MASCVDFVLSSSEQVICLHPAETGTDWPQVVVNGLGVLIAAMVAIWVGTRQHSAQVLHNSRQDVARFVSLADRALAVMRDGQDAGNRRPEQWESPLAEMLHAANLVRLTAPLRIYKEASVLEDNLREIEMWLLHDWPGADDFSDPNSLDRRIFSHSELKRNLIEAAVNHSWWARRKAAFLDRLVRNSALRRMRQQGIEGCVDGPSIYNRSL